MLTIRNVINRATYASLFEKIYRHTLLKRIVLSEKDTFRKQEQLLNRIISHSLKHVTFYNKYAKSSAKIKLSDLPIITKQDITNNYSSFVADNFEIFGPTDGYTGGSTGEPFHLVLAGGFEYDFGVKRWNVYGYKKGELILAMDGSKIDENDIKNNIFWKKKNSPDVPFGSYAISSLYYNEHNAKMYCSFIAKLQPDYIRGYPSFIYEVACCAERLGVNISGKIKAIELTSESVFSYQIEKIKKIFNAKVYLQYGHTESCVCAYTYDETYKYRVEPLYGYVEVVNNNGEHVKEGEVGEVVVTSLHNYAMPLIRYRTGDFAEYGGRDTRYSYLNRIYGRTQDYIYDVNKNKVLLTALIFAQHCSALGHINKWQIEQYEPGKVILHIVKGLHYSVNDENEIFELFLKSGNVKSEFNYVNLIPLTPRGKSKMLIQHIE